MCDQQYGDSRFQVIILFKKKEKEDRCVNPFKNENSIEKKVNLSKMKSC